MNENTILLESPGEYLTTDRITHTCQAEGADGQVSKPDIGRIRETISEHLPE